MRAEEGHARWASSLGRPSRLSPLLETKGRAEGAGRPPWVEGVVGVSQGGWPWDLTRRRLRGAAHPSTQPSAPEGPAHSTQAAAVGGGERRWEDDIP